MNVREHMKEIRLSRARLEALTQRRGRCVQLGAFHSEGGSDALERLRREIDRRIDAVAEQTLAAERLIDTVSDANQRDVLGEACARKGAQGDGAGIGDIGRPEDRPADCFRQGGTALIEIEN